MKTVIVLAMHGMPSNDFPKSELAELFGLHALIEHAVGTDHEMLARRYDELDAKMRDWPRTTQNDPFYAGSEELAASLSQATGCEVIIGFNEFCAPGLAEAFDRAVAQGADKVIVVTPMMTKGGEHSEQDIPAAIRQAQERHPAIPFLYAWPFELSEMAHFLAAQIARLG